MTAPENGLLAAAAEYQKAAADLRELIREGREVIREMREVRRDMEATGREIENHFATRLEGIIQPLCDKTAETITARFDERFQQSRAWLDKEFAGAARKIAGLNDLIAEFQGRDLRLPPVVGQVPRAFGGPGGKRRKPTP